MSTSLRICSTSFFNTRYRFIVTQSRHMSPALFIPVYSSVPQRLQCFLNTLTIHLWYHHLWCRWLVGCG
jgi:hypothetical protein